MNMQVFEMLKALEGKKLQLSFYDKESDQWVLVFEDQKAFLVDDINEIGDFAAFTDKTLQNELPYAETMMALQKIAVHNKPPGDDIEDQLDSMVRVPINPSDIKTEPTEAVFPPTDGVQQSEEGVKSEQAGSDQVGTT